MLPSRIGRSPLGAPYRSPLGVLMNSSPVDHVGDEVSGLLLKNFKVLFRILDAGDNTLLHDGSATANSMFLLGDDTIVDDAGGTFDFFGKFITETELFAPLALSAIAATGFSATDPSDTASSHAGWTAAAGSFNISILSSPYSTTPTGAVVKLAMGLGGYGALNLFDGIDGNPPSGGHTYEQLAGFCLRLGASLVATVEIDAAMPAPTPGDGSGTKIAYDEVSFEVEIL